MAKKPAKSKPKPSTADESQRARRIYKTLSKTYPHAKCALDHRDAFELLMATILSAQCTDERVNMTTPALFARYPDAASLGSADQADVERIVKSCGFYRQKAKSLIAASRDIAAKHGGRVPDTMDDLLTLRGVARKTANVVLGNAYGQNVGVVVDTHVRRLANRMGFTKHQDPRKIELDLMRAFPRDDWTMLSHLLIWHGRKVCTARKPQCDACPIAADCPKVGVATDSPQRARRTQSRNTK